jgi:hypothetical protein
MSRCQITRWDDDLHVEMLHKQIRAATKGEAIPCRCGSAFLIPKSLNRIFRCFFCGEWFCYRCAPAHFDRTEQVFDGGMGI